MEGARNTVLEEATKLSDRALARAAAAAAVEDGAIGEADHLDGGAARFEDPFMNLPIPARTRCPCSRKRPPG